MRRRQNEDPEQRREREFDTITFVLAGVLGVIILCAIGYGIFKSSRGATNIPSLTAGWQIPNPPEPPASTTGSR
jgi:hypothetical protein